MTSNKNSFVSPPDLAKPRVYWWWLYNRVDKEGIIRDLEEFKAKGISGVNLICTGGYAGKAIGNYYCFMKNGYWMEEWKNWLQTMPLNCTI